ncbi:unnamed protein product [Callosobruchus maculatus]|uniref:Uncharacterized protein n=1 Tax=Callosobruchus maculatus TaxID=64391 RepID=A0A653D0M6_CALMS|nr:unnamed protein product [Callosobruchus maculatus]
MTRQSILSLRSPHPYRAVSVLLVGRRPLVFMWVHSHWLKRFNLFNLFPLGSVVY